MKSLRKVSEVVQVSWMIVTAAVFFYAFLKYIVEPLAPLATIIFVLVGTIFTFGNKRNAIMSVSGIMLYAASWLAVNAWGTWPGMLVWMVGVLAWFTAVHRSFPEYLPTPKTTIA